MNNTPNDTVSSIVEELVNSFEVYSIENDSTLEANNLPENSETLTLQENTSRFSSAIWYNNVKKQEVILAGLGGIGSYIAFLLGRLQVQWITMYDPDIVEVGNMSGQLYGSSNIGQYKAKATALILREFANYYAGTYRIERYINGSRPGKIMICGFDNMEARRVFFNSWLREVESASESERHTFLYIDGRLAAEEFQVFCITGDDKYNIKKYKDEWLFNDSEAEATICSYKQTSFMANMIASVIVNLFVNFCANTLEGEDAPLIARDLPFMTTYEASQMTFNTIN